MTGPLPALVDPCRPTYPYSDAESHKTSSTAERLLGLSSPSWHRFNLQPGDHISGSEAEVLADPQGGIRCSRVNRYTRCLEQSRYAHTRSMSHSSGRVVAHPVPLLASTSHGTRWRFLPRRQPSLVRFQSQAEPTQPEDWPPQDRNSRGFIAAQSRRKRSAAPTTAVSSRKVLVSPAF
jgi:hypothetical protein